MKLINVTDITGYLYCPRKLWLKLNGVKEPLNSKMVLGIIRHKIFDSFNKIESSIVSSLEKAEKNYIKNAYFSVLEKIISEVHSSNFNMAVNFGISKELVSESVMELMQREISLRIRSILEIMGKGLRGKELWRELKPKYLTEFEIISPELGLKGRVDRVRVGNEILPYEIKSRLEIYDSDKIQLSAYALLLEKEFNKKIDKAIVEAMSKQQIIEITPEMKSKVLEIAEKIRNLSEPQFSSNFAKCNKCALKDVCFK